MAENKATAKEIFEKAVSMFAGERKDYPVEATVRAAKWMLAVAKVKVLLELNDTLKEILDEVRMKQ